MTLGLHQEQWNESEIGESLISLWHATGIGLESGWDLIFHTELTILTPAVME